MKTNKMFLAVLLILTLFLGFFQCIWVTLGSPTSVMYQVMIQRARSERFEKDALILLYRPSGIERTAAISEMQNALPLFEQAENGLTNGDSRIGLPAHPPDAVRLDMVNVQGDYLTIDVAVTNILAHTRNASVDPTQVQLIMDHEHNYAIIMSQVTTIWQNQIDTSFYNIFWVEMTLDIAIMLFVILTYVYPHTRKEPTLSVPSSISTS